MVGGEGKMIEYIFIILAAIFAFLYANSPSSSKPTGAALRMFFLSGMFFMAGFAFLSLNLRNDLPILEKNVASWSFYAMIIFGVFFLFVFTMLYLLKIWRKMPWER